MVILALILALVWGLTFYSNRSYFTNQTSIKTCYLVWTLSSIAYFFTLNSFTDKAMFILFIFCDFVNLLARVKKVWELQPWKKKTRNHICSEVPLMPLSLGVWWPLTAVQLSNTVEDFRKTGPNKNFSHVLDSNVILTAS